MTVQENLEMGAYTRSNAEAEALKAEAANVIDLEGRMMLPGFIDAHMHLSIAGPEMLYKVVLHDLDNEEDYLKRIKEYVDSHPEMEKYEGGHVNPTERFYIDPESVYSAFNREISSSSGVSFVTSSTNCLNGCLTYRILQFRILARNIRVTTNWRTPGVPRVRVIVKVTTFSQT